MREVGWSVPLLCLFRLFWFSTLTTLGDRVRAFADTAHMLETASFAEVAVSIITIVLPADCIGRHHSLCLGHWLRRSCGHSPLTLPVLPWWAVFRGMVNRLTEFTPPLCAQCHACEALGINTWINPCPLSTSDFCCLLTEILVVHDPWWISVTSGLPLWSVTYKPWGQVPAAVGGCW